MPLVSLAALGADNLRGKRVLIRQDLNVPIAHGKIVSSKRLEAALDTIRLALDAGAKVMLMSHVGRPDEGRFDAAMSLAPMADYLGAALGREVKLHADYLARPPTLADGQVAVLENVRFNVGEKANDPGLSRQYAALCDIFVMDAFGAAHRTQASTHGVIAFAPLACAGPLLLAELDALGMVLKTPRRPLVGIVGGAKVSTKLAAIETLSAWVDCLIPGGGIANTFLKAAGHHIGNSVFEADLVPAARRLLRAAAARGHPIPLPSDVVVGKALAADAEAKTKLVHELAEDDCIFDIGLDTIAHYTRIIQPAGAIIWNGPVGVFEFPQFARGTEALGRAMAASDAFSVAGGGDTLAAAERFGLTDKLSCISTGGGAFLEFLEGKTLPAVAALEARGGCGG